MVYWCAGLAAAGQTSAPALIQNERFGRFFDRSEAAKMNAAVFPEVPVEGRGDWLQAEAVSENAARAGATPITRP